MDIVNDKTNDFGGITPPSPGADWIEQLRADHLTAVAAERDFDLRAAAMYTAGRSLMAVAESLQVTVASVNKALRRTQTKKRTRGRPPYLDGLKPIVLELDTLGMSPSEIAGKVGISPQSVLKIRRAAGRPPLRKARNQRASPSNALPRGDQADPGVVP